jgi:hypothetical protein
MSHILGRAGPGPQLGWAVPDLCRAKNCVLWASLLGTAQMYTYSFLHVIVSLGCPSIANTDYYLNNS